MRISSSAGGEATGEGLGIVFHFDGLRMEGGDGLTSDGFSLSIGEEVEEFEAAATADDLGAQGLGGGADFTIWPAQGGAELGAGLPGSGADQMGAEVGALGVADFGLGGGLGGGGEEVGLGGHWGVDS